jgi:para-aminobenzoate synthetase/4-amino-4-deoxychorismate lyase
MTFTDTDLTAPFVLLEDRLTPGAAARLYVDPVEVVCCDTPETVDAAFARIEAGIAGGLHAAGLFGYELGYALEPRLAALMPARRSAPLLWFGLFRAPRLIAADALDAAFAALGPPPPITQVTAGHDRAEHVAKVARVLALIAAGDIYQANLTFPMRFRYNGDPLALYAALRASQPVAHGGMVAMGDLTILSASPELFVSTAGDIATTRPMKGTTARHSDPAEDEEARRALAADPKQRAENLMIVDLLRNDLSRISTPGSVRTPALFTMESYPSFHALTSTVTGQLRAGTGLRERIAALFPCGSIVGAPKIRAGQVIADLEGAARGVYTGSIGAIAPGGDMAFNVAIRTAVLSPNGTGHYGVGGGIVADSDGDAEYDEALLKARVLTDLAYDYELIETFRWAPAGGYVRLGLHLDRMAASAVALGFQFDRSAAEAALVDAARDFSQDERVRVALARDGGLAITHQALPEPVDRPLKLCVADYALDAGDPFLRHKTGRRSQHEAAFAAAARSGCGEALLLNRNGVVADASRNSVFAMIDGRLITPPIAAGALPGILRATMIASGEAVEGALTLADLHAATALFVGNSLHGLRPAYLSGGLMNKR